METISWSDFNKKYLSSVLGEEADSLDPNRLQLLTQLLVSDLTNKGISGLSVILPDGVVTSIEASFEDAFYLLALGIRVRVLADPVVKISSPSGLDITRSEELIIKVQADFALHLRAYLIIRVEASQTASQFWTSYADIVSGGDSSGGSCCLTFSEQLQLKQADAGNEVLVEKVKGVNRLQLEQEKGRQDKALLDYRQYLKRLDALVPTPLAKQTILQYEEVVLEPVVEVELPTVPLDQPAIALPIYPTE